MKWNNSKERAKFLREQNRLKEQYEQAGMTNEQIQDILDFDKEVFNAKRREAVHTQKLDFSMFDDDITEDGQNPLLEKFLEMLTVELDLSNVSRYSWIDEIDNEFLAKTLKSLPQVYLEILTMIVIDGMTQAEIAREQGVSQQYISQIFQKIKRKFYESACKNGGFVGYHLRGNQ